MSRKSRFSAEQIAYALKQVDAGVPVAEVCRKYGVSQGTYYRWRSKYGELAPSEVRRMKELEAENRRMKSIIADLTLDKEILQDALKKKH